MKRTFTTVMPNQIGAFLEASSIFSKLSLNITRVSYNKAIDSHRLFIEAEGEEKALDEAAEMLYAIGYLPKEPEKCEVAVLEFSLRDKPGEVEKVLELISACRFNIVYISSKENGTPYQPFRMGLLVHDREELTPFIHRVSALCRVRFVPYDRTEISLDNSAFYTAFAEQIADELNLSGDEKEELTVQSNLVMELLTSRNSPPYKTFEYIGRFSKAMRQYKGNAYRVEVTAIAGQNGITATVFQPPCGSNITVFDTPDGYLLIDGGFPCYRAETLAALKKHFPDFDGRKKCMLLTHADVDHVGIIEDADTVYLSRKAYESFVAENNGRENFREQNPLHAPYVRISKILSGYRPVDLSAARIIGGTTEPIRGLYEKIGTVRFGTLCFTAYEAAGGHVLGETVYVEENAGFIASGDIFVNIGGFTREQAAFNRLAPYLMTSVDTDPALAAEERGALLSLLPLKERVILCGHGAPITK